MLGMSELSSRSPTILTVPGLTGAGAGHWMTLWERARRDTVRADVGGIATPRRNGWVTRLDQSIRTVQAPVILVGHCLGVLTIAWWAALNGQPWGAPVGGALLVAPPDVDCGGISEDIGSFGPSPRTLLPFPSILVASSDDPFSSVQRSFDMARDWGSAFVEVGSAGHFTVDSDLGWWEEGQLLLERLIAADGGPLGGPTSDLTRPSAQLLQIPA
jgi:predicted alpha/beta hydrolase family esterase